MTSNLAQVSNERIDHVSRGLLDLRESRKNGVSARYLPDMVISQVVTKLLFTLDAAGVQSSPLSKAKAKRIERVYEPRLEFYRTLARRSDELLSFAYSATRKLSADERHIIFFALGLSGTKPKFIKINLRDFMSMGRSLRHKLEETKGVDGYTQVGATLPPFFASSEFNALMGGVHTRDFYKALLAIRKKMSEPFQMGLQQLCARVMKKNLSDTYQVYSIFDVLSQFDRNYLTYFSGLRNYCYHMMRTVKQERRKADIPRVVDCEPVCSVSATKVPSQWLSAQEAKFFTDLCEENKILRLPEALVKGDSHLCHLWSYYKKYRDDCSGFSLVSFLDQITAQSAGCREYAANLRAQELEKLRALRVAVLLAQRIAVAHKRAIHSPYAQRVMPEMRSIAQAAIQIYLSDVEKLLHALKAAIQSRSKEQGDRVLYDFTTGFYQ